MIWLMYPQSSCLSTAALIFYTCIWIPFHQLKMSLFNLLRHYYVLMFPQSTDEEQQGCSPEMEMSAGCRYQDYVMRKVRNDEEGGCPICLVEWESGEEDEEVMVTELPDCGHLFHLNCIHNWVDTLHFTCPLCRSPFFIFSTPTTIPTSFSHHHLKYFSPNYFHHQPPYLHNDTYSFLSF